MVGVYSGLGACSSIASCKSCGLGACGCSGKQEEIVSQAGQMSMNGLGDVTTFIESTIGKIVLVGAAIIMGYIFIRETPARKGRYVSKYRKAGGVDDE